MDVREAMLDAAIKVFGKAGMRGATTRRIAEEAGVNEVTLFRHFRSKHELMQAALAHFAASAQSRPLPAIPVNPRAELVEWCRAHHRELYKRRALIRKAMGELEQHPSCCTHGLQAAVRVAQELTGYLRRLRAAGLAAGNWDERVATNLLMGAIFADVMGRDTMPERYPYAIRDGVEHYVDLLLAGVGAVKTTRKPGARATP